MSRRLFKVCLSLLGWIAFALVLDCSFIDEHHRDIVANRINAATLHALQALAVGSQFHLRLASRASENFQQILTNCHWCATSSVNFLEYTRKQWAVGSGEQ